MIRLFLLPFLLISATLSAQEITVGAGAYHGGPLALTIDGGTEATRYTVTWQGASLGVAPDCDELKCSQKLILPAQYDNPGMHELVVDFITPGAKAQRISQLINVENKEYPEQKLSVDPRFVTLSEDNATRAAAERLHTVEALNSFNRERFWELPLVKPVPGALTGNFGSRRTFNGEPRSRHSGTDFRAAEGTAVTSAAPGVVVLTANHYFAGNSVYVDHGLGLVSMYFHLSEIDVAEGDWVNTGDVVGKSGATGRVTGPHLHFGLAAQGKLIDAAGLF